MDGSNLAMWAAILVSLGVGAVNIRQAARANTTADRSAEAAAEATRMARAADERAARLERVQFERRDVQWSTGWDEKRQAWVATNTGQDTAFEIEWTVDVGAVRKAERAPRVDPLGEVVMELRGEAAAARVSFGTSQRSLAASGIAYVGNPKLEIRERLSWRSEAGIWSITAKEKTPSV